MHDPGSWTLCGCYKGVARSPQPLCEMKSASMRSSLPKAGSKERRAGQRWHPKIYEYIEYLEDLEAHSLHSSSTFSTIGSSLLEEGAAVTPVREQYVCMSCIYLTDKYGITIVRSVCSRKIHANCRGDKAGKRTARV